jgi:hypothetical protein
VKSVSSKPAKYSFSPQAHNIFIIFHQDVSQSGAELGKLSIANVIQKSINKERI